MPLAAHIRSALSYARRNAPSIALLTAAAGVTVVVTTHLRRQSQSVERALRQQRLQGAKRLRSIFISNAHSIRTAFRNLLPNLRNLIANSPAVDTATPLARLRERPTDLAEKHTLWQTLMVASLTHLASSIYLSALLHSFLSLQMNILARYNLPPDVLDGGAAPWQLPAGSLSGTTSKSFLDIILLLVLNESHVNSVVSRIQSAVKSVSSQVDLAHTPSTDEIAKLITTILENSWNDISPSSSSSASDGGDDDNDVDDHHHEHTRSLSVMLHSWLYEQVGAQCEEDSVFQKDVNYKWLVGELLDLCEVLDFNHYVYNNSLIMRDFVMRRLYDDIESKQVIKRPTFARLLARFSSLASTVLSGREQISPSSPTAASSEQDSEQSPADESVDRCLAENDVGMYFAASVFLSGERDTSKSMTHT